VALAALYDALTVVVLGTTLGIMVANAPAVWAGKALAGRINMEKTRWLAAALFLLMGVWSLAGESNSADTSTSDRGANATPRTPATLFNPVHEFRVYSVRVHG
jgi:hypothetical protein